MNPLISTSFCSVKTTVGKFGTFTAVAQLDSSSRQNVIPHTLSIKIKNRRNGNPDPEAEVIALSPRMLMAGDRFVCEICTKVFPRDQNLQLHRRGHGLPLKLQKPISSGNEKKAFVCPEVSCIYHHPSRALGSRAGLKKHYGRKHGEKKWKCRKCSKIYALESDLKLHSKICYKCDCGTTFSRKEKYDAHKAFCARISENPIFAPPSMPPPTTTNSQVLLHPNIAMPPQAHSFCFQQKYHLINPPPQFSHYHHPLNLPQNSFLSGHPYSYTQISHISHSTHSSYQNLLQLPHMNVITPTFQPLHSRVNPHPAAFLLQQETVLAPTSIDQLYSTMTHLDVVSNTDTRPMTGILTPEYPRTFRSGNFCRVTETRDFIGLNINQMFNGRSGDNKNLEVDINANMRGMSSFGVISGYKY